MFINLTNHPSNKWGEEQYLASKEYGEIIDIKFPMIDPKASKEDIAKLAMEYKEKIMLALPDCLLTLGEKPLEASERVCVCACVFVEGENCVRFCEAQILDRKSTRLNSSH